MNYSKKSVRDVDVKGKRVLLRCDFNVPLSKDTGEITSDKRIAASLPTIEYLLKNGAKVIACSHLGKPKGEFKKDLSLAPVAKRLSELLNMPVAFAHDAREYRVVVAIGREGDDAQFVARRTHHPVVRQRSIESGYSHG